MFDKKKIIFNHIYASKNLNKRINNFFLKISSMLVDRANLSNHKEYYILEIASRNNSLIKVLNKKKIHCNLYQTVLNSKILEKNKNNIVANMEDQVFDKNIFDICFCILSMNSSDKIPRVFEAIYKILKNKGMFLAILPSSTCINEFKSHFSSYFNLMPKYSFVPYLDIRSLGNLGSAVGFKNIIVDKEDFNLKINEPSDLWSFIRGIGESNYLLDRKKIKLKKSIFKKFLIEYYSAIKNNHLKDNTFSFNFFIGTK